MRILFVVFFLLASALLPYSAFTQTYRCRDNKTSLLQAIDSQQPFSVRGIVKLDAKQTKTKGRFAVISRYSSRNNQRGLWLGIDKGAPAMIASTNGTKSTYIVSGTKFSAVESAGVMALTYVFDPGAKNLTFYVNGIKHGSAQLSATQLPLFNSSAAEKIGCVERSSSTPDQVFPGEVFSVGGERRIWSAAEVSARDANFFSVSQMNFWSDIPRTSVGSPQTSRIVDAISATNPSLYALSVGPPRTAYKDYKKSLLTEIPNLRTALSSSIKTLRVTLPGYNLIRRMGAAHNGTPTMAEASGIVAAQAIANLPSLPKLELVLDDFMSFRKEACTGEIRPSHLEYARLGEVCRAVRQNTSGAHLPVTAVIYCSNNPLTGRQIDAIKKVNGQGATSNQVSGFLTYLQGLRTSPVALQAYPELKNCITGVELYAVPELTTSMSLQDGQTVMKSCLNQIRQYDPSLQVTLGVYVKRFDSPPTSGSTTTNSCSGAPSEDNGAPEFTSPVVSNLQNKLDQLQLLSVSPATPASIFGALSPSNFEFAATALQKNENAEAELLRTKILPAYIGLQGNMTAVRSYVNELAALNGKKHSRKSSVKKAELSVRKLLTK